MWNDFSQHQLQTRFKIVFKCDKKIIVKCLVSRSVVIKKFKYPSRKSEKISFYRLKINCRLSNNINKFSTQIVPFIIIVPFSIICQRMISSLFELIHLRLGDYVSFPIVHWLSKISSIFVFMHPRLGDHVLFSIIHRLRMTLSLLVHMHSMLGDRVPLLVPSWSFVDQPRSIPYICFE